MLPFMSFSNISKYTYISFHAFLWFLPISVNGQYSIARIWNEANIFAIEHDFTKPTVQARNLHHITAGMYDAWAVFDTIAKPYFLGKTVGGYAIPFTGFSTTEKLDIARAKAISYTAYRMIKSRYAKSPKSDKMNRYMDSLMVTLQYDTAFVSTDYSTGDSRALGNYIAEQILAFGLQDGANEANDYICKYYVPTNPSLQLDTSGTNGIIDMDRWQPLRFKLFIDQGGNIDPNNIPKFLSAEWGNVVPFALNDADKVVKTRDSTTWNVYFDPGPPAFIDDNIDTVYGQDINFYKWGFTLVNNWSTHHNVDDETMWDISPASIGNLNRYPTTPKEFTEFYDYFGGGDYSTGYSKNPYTNQPYPPQFVKRGDYSRVLVEYWADGPNSVTPPGHWFTILNYVNDQPALIKKFNGKGPELEDLEWDIKSYFTLGGALHDAAIAAWSIKGYYDNVRPISALRGMSELGQCTDPNLPHYNPKGLPLIPGYIELITKTDGLVGNNLEYLWDLKIKAWRGYNYLTENGVAGVGWIRAKDWVTYQRANFVTPPFGGYVSGHSTFSRAAAETLTLITGDPFFPSGIGEFHFKAGEFLRHEYGPSQDITLQWAKYTDAADQCGLSRIWGGIHPPVDDIPGRKIGKIVGPKCFDFAKQYFYRDNDHDGFLSFEDCNDYDARINPNTIWYADFDGDGYVNVQDSLIGCNDIDSSFITSFDALGSDCDDTNPLINPNTIWYHDSDGDKYPNKLDSLIQCEQITGFIISNDSLVQDCDDTNALIHPNAIEIANNNIDEDCDGEDFISNVQNEVNSTISLFPNPSKQGETISINSTIEIIDIGVYNTQGIRMSQVEFLPSLMKLTSEFLPPGVYYIITYDKTQSPPIRHKLIVI